MTTVLFLYVYIIFLGFFGFFSLAALYHAIRFGEKNLVTLIMTFLYIAVTIMIVFLTLTALDGVHWSTPLFEKNTSTIIF